MTAPGRQASRFAGDFQLIIDKLQNFGKPSFNDFRNKPPRNFSFGALVYFGKIYFVAVGNLARKGVAV